MKLNQLKERKTSLVAKLEALDSRAETEERLLNEDEKKEFDATKAEIDQVNEEIARKETLGEVKSDLDKVENRSATPADGNLKKGAFSSLGEQMQAVMRACNPSNPIVDKRLLEIRASGASEQVGADGGFLVQQDFAGMLLKDAYASGVLASRVRRIPLSAKSNGLKMYGVDETSRVDGSRWGGIVSYWADEAAQYTKSKPKFREMNMKLNKLIGLCYATDELLEDSDAMESVIKQGFTEEFAFKIDDVILSGNGVGKPLGILNSSALVTVAKEGGQAAATILMENIVKMYSRLFARSYSNCVWFANQNIIPQLFLMKFPGSTDMPVYLPANSVAGQPFDTLFGRPIIFIEHAATLGDLGDIVLADLSQYVMIDKNGIKASSSVHVRFDYDEQVFKFTYRVDGQPIWSSALTPYKGTATVSPFVALALRA